MNDHVAVGMRGHAAIVRDAHAAQHHVIARFEGVHVVAGPTATACAGPR